MQELSPARLEELLKKIDGSSYKNYKRLKGGYRFREYVLFIDHVQGDPFASPSKFRIRVPQTVAGFPLSLYRNKIREIALRDFLTRRFSAGCRKFCKGKRGDGNSGKIFIDTPGQEVLERTSVLVNNSFVEVRFFVGLPARGRRIKSAELKEMLWKELPQIFEFSLKYSSLNPREVQRFVEIVEDAQFIRDNLSKKGLVAFIADGSLLPRRSGIDDRPMERSKAVLFESPPSLKVKFDTPNSGTVTGMGVPAGVTLIIGGGYHGKTTLLDAIEKGVYNHVPGDGREFVVTVPDAVKVRAEDGRSVVGVDISRFISNLPDGRDTRFFYTENASGSTSQAANIMEALEVGTRLLLMDEDTCATNFLIRDGRMQALVSKDKEPITPFIDRIRQLYTEHGVSTIMVFGGSGDYFDVADTVIMMDSYRPKDVTEDARKICKGFPSNRRVEAAEKFGQIKSRLIDMGGISPMASGKVKVKAKGLHYIQFGRHIIDLSFVEQLVDESQTRAIALSLYWLWERMRGKRTLREGLKDLFNMLKTEGLDALSLRNEAEGNLAMPRPYEIAAAINRIRGLKVRGAR